MSDWLLVRLARDATQASGWVTVSPAGELLDAHSSGSPDGLAAASAGKRVALLVPGADVLQLVASLPAGSESRLAQIVPFALEEQVSEDLDSLHFAVGRAVAGPGTPTCVNVVSRSLLERWLGVASATGLAPVALYAESELVPVIPGHVTALLEEDTLTVRMDGSRPLVLPADDPGIALELALGPDADRLLACHLTVYATSVDWAQHATAFEALQPRLASMRVQLLSGGALPLLGSQLLSSGAINLLQGPYAPARPAGAGWHEWRVAAALAGALLCVHLVAAGLQLRRMTAVEKTLDAGIQQAFAQAMPGEAGSSNARPRMEQRLKQLRAATPEGGSLLALLSAVATAHAAAPATHIEAMSYRKGSLDLKVTGPDADSLERMNQSLRGAGLASELAAGSTRGQTYEGRLQLRSAGS